MLPIQSWLNLRNPVSALTHLAGAVFSVMILIYLCRVRCRLWTDKIALAIFGASATLLYCASFVYHAVMVSAVRLIVFQLLDQSAIYLLIAGTTTSTVVCLLPPTFKRSVLLAALWGMALAGIVCKWTLFQVPYPMVVGPYILMGWISGACMISAYPYVGMQGLRWIILGGISYTVGALLDAFNWPTLIPGIFGPHELFHIFVLGGTALHFLFIAKYVVPRARQSNGEQNDQRRSS